LIGATLAGRARRGEVLSDVGLLGPRLAESGDGAEPCSITPITMSAKSSWTSSSDGSELAVPTAKAVKNARPVRTTANTNGIVTPSAFACCTVELAPPRS
jgi:hypothetical protein